MSYIKKGLTIAEEANRPQFTKEDLRPFIRNVGNEIDKMLADARREYGNRYNKKNKYEELYRRFCDPQKDPDKFYDEYALIVKKQSTLPAAVRTVVDTICSRACYAYLTDFYRKQAKENLEKKEEKQ